MVVLQVRELVGQYVSPILQLALTPDDPRARAFSIAVNDSSLAGASRQ